MTNLVAAKMQGVSADGATLQWLSDIGDRLHRKLVFFNLAKSRQRQERTIGELLSKYFELVKVKSSTRTTYEQTERVLKAHFGESKPLAAIGELEGEEWRKAMQDEGLAQATVSRRVKTARQIFKKACKWKWITENPFADVVAGSQKNKSRQFFVERPDVEKLVNACPSRDWKLVILLARYGGLRIPSELAGLTWADINWHEATILVHSPKTEHLESRDTRLIPLYPELKPLLLEAFTAADEGTVHVITDSGLRRKTANLRTGIERLMTRAQVKPWPKAFQNMRSSRQTELAEKFPHHVVEAWMGNSEDVADDHYYQVRESDFRRANGLEEKVAQNPAQQGEILRDTEEQTPNTSNQNHSDLSSDVSQCSSVTESLVTPTTYGDHDVRAREITAKTAIKWRFCHSLEGREARKYFAARQLQHVIGVGYDNSSELANKSSIY